MSDKHRIVTIALSQHDLHTIITALEFRANLWESDIATSDEEVAENSRDLALIETFKRFKDE